MKTKSNFESCTDKEKIERLLKAIEWLTDKMSNIQYQIQEDDNEEYISDANKKYLYESIIGERLRNVTELISECFIEWAKAHYWDSLQKDKNIIIKHIRENKSLIIYIETVLRGFYRGGRKPKNAVQNAPDESNGI